MRVNENFEKKVHRILKTYDSVLVRCKNIPIQIDKNVIIVTSIDGMVNAQIETRKPILYFKEDDSMSFMIVDGTEIYAYIIKKYPEKVCAVENVINNFDSVRNTFFKEMISKFQNILLDENSENDKSENKSLKDSNLLSFSNIDLENLTGNYKEQNSNDDNIKNVNFQENNTNLGNNGQNITNFSNGKNEIENNGINNNNQSNYNNEVNNNKIQKNIDNIQTNLQNNNQNINSSNEVSLALIKKRKKFNWFGLINKSKKNAKKSYEKNKKAI